MNLEWFVDDVLLRPLLNCFLTPEDWTRVSLSNKLLWSIGSLHSCYSLPASDSRSAFYIDIGNLPALSDEEGW